MTLQDKYTLLSEDPVTVARYFENRMHALFKLTFREGGVFRDKPVRDYFWRVDFQNRGSPHVHCLAWLTGAPVYPEGKPECESDRKAYDQKRKQCTEFIDSYITVERPDNGFIYESEWFREENPMRTKKKVTINYQLHRCYKDHCFVINKDGVQMCKYGYPWPILTNTMILEPLADMPEHMRVKHMNNYRVIRDMLISLSDEVEKDPRLRKTQNELLFELGISHEAYIMALRYSITRQTVFLKRDCRSLRLNAYNRDLIVRHRANMDIQYIVDPYGVALYVSAYMLKSKAVMSKLLKNCESEMSYGCLNTKDKLISLSNKFQNCTEVCAQEAVYILLNMEVCHNSRDVQYINTYPIESRSKMVKKKRVLVDMRPDSTNIYTCGIVDHYMQRHKSLEGLCFAEFATLYNYFTRESMKNSLRPAEEASLMRFAEDEDEINEDNFDLLSGEEGNIEAGNTEVEKITSKADVPDNYKGFIQQQDGKGFVKKRKQQRIIRCKRYNLHKDPDNFHRVEMLLYLPFRNEKAEINIKSPNLKSKYDLNEEGILSRKRQFENVDSELFDAAIDFVEDEVINIIYVNWWMSHVNKLFVHFRL